MASTTSTSNKDLIRLAAWRNCEGASFLAEEELEEAVANFTTAYHCIGQAIIQQNEDQDDEVGNNDDESDEEECLPSESVDKYHFILDTSEVAWFTASRTQPGGSSAAVPAAAAAAVAHDAASTQPTTTSFVCKEALVFHPESASDPRETPFFEAVILFNLALVFHQNGRHHSCLETRQGCLIRGLRCYNHCLRLLKEGNYDHSINSIQANRVVEAHLLIASLNNKAQTLVAMSEYHQAYWILQELGSVLAASAGDPPGFETEEKRGLEATMELLNTPEMTAVQDSAMAAAAAARAGPAVVAS